MRHRDVVPKRNGVFSRSQAKSCKVSSREHRRTMRDMPKTRFLFASHPSLLLRITSYILPFTPRSHQQAAQALRPSLVSTKQLLSRSNHVNRDVSLPRTLPRRPLPRSPRSSHLEAFDSLLHLKLPCLLLHQLGQLYHLDWWKWVLQSPSGRVLCRRKWDRGQSIFPDPSHLA